MSAVSERAFYQPQNYRPRRSLSTRDYNDRYQAPPAYTAQQPLASQAARLGHASVSQEYPYPQPYPQVGGQYGYPAVGAPILPPIRVTDGMDFSAHYAQQHTESKPKEEKPTGGVAQHLDYDMDLMSNFVAEMSQKLYVVPNALDRALKLTIGIVSHQIRHRPLSSGNTSLKSFHLLDYRARRSCSVCSI
jgi:hypothetical protein